MHPTKRNEIMDIKLNLQSRSRFRLRINLGKRPVIMLKDVHVTLVTPERLDPGQILIITYSLTGQERRRGPLLPQFLLLHYQKLITVRIESEVFLRQGPGGYRAGRR